ncbi:unnamed protein product [Ectocarpus sp. CCAP 1310/34]|nr:unnamed protein product [Ectocarpus sp. CCAP 1310/34]
MCLPATWCRVQQALRSQIPLWIPPDRWEEAAGGIRTSEPPTAGFVWPYMSCDAELACLNTRDQRS